MFFEEFIDFVISHRSEILDQTLEHLWLTLVALSFAVLIGVSVGIYLTRNSKISGPVLGFVNAIQTVPSLALLGFMIPLIGIGATPAIVALFLYALLPIVRNTYTGITGVDASVKEAALGMGLSNYQLLSKVEVPLAIPVIFAGIRTAFVINVGVATLAALIAAGGLGEFIFRGISLNNAHMILAGAIPAALLALIFDYLLGIIENHIFRIMKPVLISSLILMLIFIPYFFYSAVGGEFRAGFPSEFIERGDGYKGLEKMYDLNMDFVEMEIGLMYQAVKNKNVDVISGFSTDGRIKAYNLRTLKDDRNYFPPYHAAPIIRKEVLETYPKLNAVFKKFDEMISDEEMIKMNFEVDNNKKDPKTAAMNFLIQQGLDVEFKDKEGEPDIIIGSKNFTESFILAEMFKIMIENFTPLKVELKLGFGGTKLVFDALNNGEIDLYPEYTGTGFLVIINPPESIKNSILYNKKAVLDYVRKEFEERYDIVWMPTLGFNNTFALMMREEHAERLGIRTISELSEYLKRND